MSRRVFNYFNCPPSPSLKCSDASLTRQEFMDEADINKIMARYAAGIPSPNRGSRPPMFGDFSNVPDYQTSLNHVIEAQDRFNQLPSALRKRFDNDPAKLLAFLADENNREEGAKLGLLKPLPVEKPVEKSVPAEAGGAGGDAPGSLLDNIKAD